jgi:hypothetical protein
LRRDITLRGICWHRIPHLPGRVTRTAALAEFYKADDDRQHRVGCSNYATDLSGFTAGVDGGRAYDAASSKQASQDLQPGVRSIPT